MDLIEQKKIIDVSDYADPYEHLKDLQKWADAAEEKLKQLDSSQKPSN